MKQSIVDWCINTPLTPLAIQVSNHGIISATLVENFAPNQEVVSASMEPHIRSVEQWVEAYFMRKELPRLEFDLHQLSSFHQLVLLQLCSVPPGKTVSYSVLAKMCSRPKAARAIGSAMARNPIGLLIPCHRVVKQNGALGAYSGWNGITTKRLLLDFESQDSSFDEFMTG
jgi:methylated-DNA-[protein]-cysteine S-methyltransferase